jgi:PleD family two-component response regulator
VVKSSEHDEEPKSLIEAADMAMYEGKLAGGNRVTVYDATRTRQRLRESLV